MKHLFCAVLIGFGLWGTLHAETTGFDDYRIFIKINGLFSFPWGDLIQQEQDSWELSVLYGNGVVKSSKPHVMQYGFDAGIEFKFRRLAIPVNYRFSVYSENVSVGDGETYEQISFSGNLMYLHTFSSGIQYYFGVWDNDEWSQYSAWFIGLLVGGEYAYLMPYPSLVSFLGMPALDSWGLIGATVGPVLGFQYIYNVFLLGFTAKANAHFLWTPDSLRSYYLLDQFVGLGDISVSVTVGLAF